MDHEEIGRLDGTAQAALVRAGEVSALELVDAAIARIEAVEPRVHALASTAFEQARDRARQAPSGAFGGVPTLAKDLLGVPGQRHAMGCRLFGANVARDRTPYVDALEAAGLVVLGKTTTSELGLLGSTESLLEGPTHNPWDLARSAGGSSGGSAAAVAARMVPFAHASDGGGSIRGPAAMNGAFGFKPGGRRMRAAGPSDMDGLLVEHFVSWSVRDSARLLALTERGEGPAGPPVGFVAGPSSRRLRIGVYETTLTGATPTEANRAALAATRALCAELGHDVSVVPPPPIDGHEVGDAFFTLAGFGVEQMSAMVAPMLGREPGEGELEPFTLFVRERFRNRGPAALEQALATVARIGETMATYLADWDAVLCPTLPIDLWELGTLHPERDPAELMAGMERLAGYTAVHNPAMVPAMSVPLHVHPEGWPIGMHFAAPRGGERTLLELAYELEEAAPWRDRLPPVHG